MHYWIDVFTVKTLRQFLRAGAHTSGWSERHAKMVQQVAPGDILVCYVTVVQTWVGALRVVGPSDDQRPIWGGGNYPVRLEVEPLVRLDLDTAVPMEQLEGKVDFYRDTSDKGKYKTFLRSGLRRFTKDGDGRRLVRLLKKSSTGEGIPLTPLVNPRSWKDAETPPPRGARRLDLGSDGSDGEGWGRNFVQKNEDDTELGHEGEEQVLAWEKERLRARGRADLADQVRQVSRESPGASYDIGSFGDAGEKLFVEVKTTTEDANRPFFVSRNEMQFSRQHKYSYCLYRVYDFRTDPKYYRLPGPVDKTCETRAEAYSAIPKGGGRERK